MVLLMLMDVGRPHYLAVFNTLESGRDFMKKVPGYHYSLEEEDGFRFEEEEIRIEALPDLVWIEHNAYKIPISRFSFEGDVTVVWIELDHVDENPKSFVPSGGKIVTGATRIDAYSINNEEVEAYVKTREEKAALVTERLNKAGFEVSRQCFGSEDGEVLFIKKRDSEEDWHFFTHLDPGFVDMDVEELFYENGGLYAEFIQ